MMISYQLSQLSRINVRKRYWDSTLCLHRRMYSSHPVIHNTGIHNKTTIQVQSWTEVTVFNLYTLVVMHCGKNQGNSKPSPRERKLRRGIATAKREEAVSCGIATALSVVMYSKRKWLTFLKNLAYRRIYQSL